MPGNTKKEKVNWIIVQIAILRMRSKGVFCAMLSLESGFLSIQICYTLALDCVVPTWLICLQGM